MNVKDSNIYYQIQIINNLTGKIIYDDEIKNHIKTNDYSGQVLRQYNEAKFKYRNTDTTISVLRFSNKEVKTMYQKVFHSKESRETIYDICTELNNNINKFLDKFEDIKLISSQLQGAYDKKTDLINHSFDSMGHLINKPKDSLTDKEREDILDITLHMIHTRTERRKVKNEQDLVNNLVQKNFINQLKNISNKIKVEKKMSIYNSNKIAEKWANHEVNIDNKYIEVPYNNFKERVRAISKLEKKI